MSYDDIGKSSGLTLMIDGLHLNDTGAKLITQAILKEVTTKAK
tara:strand:- start:218 stop:346 length:129 start_codon:yes stop_codon:yes gene_type:complete